MNQELKEKWIAALRSGKYEQGTGFLCKDGAYCCLGVLMEVSGNPEWVADVEYPSNKMIRYSYDDYVWLESKKLPNHIERQYDIMDYTATLMYMNDSQHKSFSEIADWIERIV